MVKAFLKVLIISLLLFTLTLTSCTGGKTPNINNSNEENSSDDLGEISSVVDTEDPDVKIPVSSVNNGAASTSSNIENPYKTEQNSSSIKSGTSEKSEASEESNQVSSQNDVTNENSSVVEISKPEADSSSKQQIVSSNIENAKSSTEEILCESAIFENLGVSDVSEPASSQENVTTENSSVVETSKPEADSSSQQQIVSSNTENAKTSAEETSNESIASSQGEFVPIEFPKIPTENISHAIVIGWLGQKKESVIDKEKTEKLVDFINNSEFVNFDYKADGPLRVGSSIRVTFVYEDSSTITLYESGYYTISLCDGYFNIKSGRLDDFITKELNVDLWYR